MTRPDYSMITKKNPEKKLLAVLHQTGGRNNQGKISIRFRGGGVKRKYRIVQFGEETGKKVAKVIGIEYDPNRSARIALIEYGDGERAYVIAPQGLQAGQEIVFDNTAGFSEGNRMRLKYIPVGTFVYNVELMPGQGGKIARSAGTAVKILALEGKYTTLAMPSGEVRKVLAEGYASIGSVSNPQHKLQTIGKAGRMRYRGRRPHVRGAAMNAADHPHGGGEGRTSIGLKYPKTPWGKIARGGHTRHRKKYSRMFILQRRKK